jgi:hypothetical protein
MTKEDKDLLLIDLLARLPYGVKIRLGDYDYQVCGYNSEKEMPVKIWYYYDSNLTLKSYIDVYLTDYCPYLRPLSSMTEEEKDEYSSFVLREYDGYLNDDMPDYTGKHYVYTDNVIIFTDWLNKHHFDYRGLIEKGLAIEVTKENNPYKE